MPVRTTKKKITRAKVSKDQLSSDKIRLSVAIPRSLRKKLEKLAKVRHVTLSGCVVGLLETSYADALAISTMMDDHYVRHAIMCAVEKPEFKKGVEGGIFQILSDEEDAKDAHFSADNPREVTLEELKEIIKKRQSLRD